MRNCRSAGMLRAGQTVHVRYTGNNDHKTVQRIQDLNDAGANVRLILQPVKRRPAEPSPFGVTAASAYLKWHREYLPTDALADAIGEFYRDDNVTVVLVRTLQTHVARDQKCKRRK